MGVVDHAQQGPVPGQLGQQRQGGQADQEPVRARRPGQAERAAQGPRLGRREHVEPAAALTPVDRLSLWLGRTLAWVFLIAVALTAWEVVMRYVFNSPTIWVHDLVIAQILFE